MVLFLRFHWINLDSVFRVKNHLGSVIIKRFFSLVTIKLRVIRSEENKFVVEAVCLRVV